MSLFHIFFAPNSEKYLNHKKKYKTIIDKRDLGTIEILENYQKDLNVTLNRDSILVLSEKLIKDYTTHKELSNEQLREYTRTKRKYVDEHSFRGRKSFHFWIFVFGLVSALMFFSCKSLYDDIVNGSTYRFQFISLTGIAVSFFWMIHLIFLTQSDFSKNSYILMILVCACLATFFTYFLVKNYTYKDDIILKQLSLIDKIKTIHYPRVALKALYAERNDKAMLATDTVRENADAFDNDILTTLKDV
ncbi:hypothetical protein [Tenacibaculum sp. MAR_2009_124]|uniref:hypothetical protein n=1 Tax=Tenacibaculum sp. MAR_2009_124 TaxID=1250059 RepID=UPI000B8793EC|nr:hypothetical protein [Tenacibaculum sp. MAR_2009_124]